MHRPEKTGTNSTFFLNRNLFEDDISVALAMDYKNYLQNDILAKVDRSTMSVSLEGREPLLDHRLIEFSARLPIDYKLKGNIQKNILKDIVYRYVPKEIMDRPKMGFDMPINEWLRGDLRTYMNDALDEIKIKEAGILDNKVVQKLKSDFLNNEIRNQTIIWKILQFQQWYNMWM